MSLKQLLSGQSTNVPYRLKVPVKGDLREKFFSSVGVPVHTLRPDQNIPLLRMALASIGMTDFRDDYELILKASELFQDEFKRQIRKVVHKHEAAEILFRKKPKDLTRMRDKESDAQEGAVCAASHTDLNATKVFASDIPSLLRITERLRPSHNSHTAQLKEKAVNPDENNFPGNTVKLIVERDIGAFKNVPFVTEIIILMDGCQSYDVASHDKVDIKRSLGKFWLGSNRGKGDAGVTEAIAKLHTKTHNSLPKLNQEMAKATGMDTIMQRRDYHMIDGVPVTHASTTLGDNFCFIPNAKSGFYEQDNSYLGKINAGNKCSREDFITTSQKIVPAPDTQKLSGRLLHLKAPDLVLVA